MEVFQLCDAVGLTVDGKVSDLVSSSRDQAYSSLFSPRLWNGTRNTHVYYNIGIKKRTSGEQTILTIFKMNIHNLEIQNSLEDTSSGIFLVFVTERYIFYILKIKISA